MTGLARAAVRDLVFLGKSLYISLWKREILPD